MNTVHSMERIGSTSAEAVAGKLKAQMFRALWVGVIMATPGIAAAVCDDSNNCTAYGTDALSENTSGSGNSAFGRFALRFNNTGYDNTAAGLSALSNNTTGGRNTAIGVLALFNNTIGYDNTATGIEALYFNTTGSYNTASGSRALYFNTTGEGNTASGYESLALNTEGTHNTATGIGALASNTTGSWNTANGTQALHKNTTGSSNIAVGYRAGWLPVGGANNIHIGHPGTTGETTAIHIGKQGTQKKTYIAGISGALVTGAAVVVSTAGRLGVVSSSRRYKEDIQPMGESSAALMALKPVTFRYKDTDEAGEIPIQYGLIAEDVAKVLPELVILNEDGQPETVAYHVLPSLLLNEYQKQSAQLAHVREALAERDQELAAIRTEIQALRQVTQQLVAALPSATGMEMAAQ